MWSSQSLPNLDKMLQTPMSTAMGHAVFLFIAPLRGWRRVNSYQHRTRRAWAQEVRSLLAIDYPDARQVKLLADNLNPHHLALLGEAFAAEVANRFEIPYTPRHGSC